MGNSKQIDRENRVRYSRMCLTKFKANEAGADVRDKSFSVPPRASWTPQNCFVCPYSHRTWVVWGLLLFALSCTVAQWRPTATPKPPSTPTLPPTATSAPSPTPLEPDTGWLPLDVGLEQRSLNVELGELTERITILRVDPAQTKFRVIYAPGDPRLVSIWGEQTGVRAAINAGYFTEAYEATGLIISDGERFGASYEEFAGMFTVSSQGMPDLRWLRQQPYDPAEPLTGAVQSFPLLVKPGGELGFPLSADNGVRARRSVIAKDRAGRILLMVAPRGYFTLHALSAWLTTSDLDLDIALNLDGGTSTGLWVAAGVRLPPRPGSTRWGRCRR